MNFEHDMLLFHIEVSGFYKGNMLSRLYELREAENFSYLTDRKTKSCWISSVSSTFQFFRTTKQIKLLAARKSGKVKLEATSIILYFSR